MKAFDNFTYFNNQKLDFYLPSNKNFTSIVFIHGGGIVEGDKDDDWNLNVVKCLVSKGYGVININYSLYPNAKFPEYIVDAAHAVKFAFDNVEKYGGNGEIIIFGQSAGAYITMMMCMNHNYLKDVGVDPLQIKGWFSDSSQMSDHFHYLEYEEKLNPLAQRITIHSPLYYINEQFKSNPIFLTCYTSDMHGRLEQNQLFYKTMKALSPSTNINLSVFEGGHCALAGQTTSKGENSLAVEIDKFVKNMN